MRSKYFKTDNGSILPVSEKKYLIPFLTGTAKGTKYFQPAPSKLIKKQYLADKLLQFHQLLDIFSSLGIKFKNKSFLDIGTGNGLIPKSLLITGLTDKVLGSDLYEPYEHESASIPMENKVINKFINFFKEHTRNHKLSYSNYKKHIKSTAESEVFIPQDILINKIDIKKVKNYKFKKYGAHNLKDLRKKFDLIYCKGIEHIPDWKLTVDNIASVTRKNSFVYLKTRPFYSYLGPHRYATSAIPWGHAILTDKEYVRYANQFHKNRAKQMIKSYFNTVTYPRYTIDQLIRLFEMSNFSLVCKKIETPHYLSKILLFKNEIRDFDKLVKRKTQATPSELSSSVQHLVFQKIS